MKIDIQQETLKGNQALIQPDAFAAIMPVINAVLDKFEQLALSDVTPSNIIMGYRAMTEADINHDGQLSGTLEIVDAFARKLNMNTDTAKLARKLYLHMIVKAHDGDTKSQADLTQILSDKSDALFDKTLAIQIDRKGPDLPDFITYYKKRHMLRIADRMAEIKEIGNNLPNLTQAQQAELVAILTQRAGQIVDKVLDKHIGILLQDQSVRDAARAMPDPGKSAPLDWKITSQLLCEHLSQKRI